MSRFHFLLWIVVVALLNYQCTTNSINIDLPAGGKRPVLLGLMTTNDSVDVFVSQTAPARGQAPVSVYLLGASVQVLADGQVMAEGGRYVGGGIYRLRRQQSLQVGVTYQVRVKAPNWETLASQLDTLPMAVPVTSFVANGTSFTLAFTDPPGPNYYMVDIELYYHNERVFKIPNFRTVFSDDLFEDRPHSVTGLLSNFATLYSPAGTERVVKADSARVRLLSVSQRTHQYYASINYYDLSAGSPEIEPTSPLSGIPGGEGYFGVGNSSMVYDYGFN